MRCGAIKAPSGHTLLHRHKLSRQYIRGRLDGSMLAAGGLMGLHGHWRCNQARILRLSADILPLFRSATSSKLTF